jgi:hypothetical protein
MKTTKLEQIIINMVNAHQGVKRVTLETQLVTSDLGLNIELMRNTIEGLIIDGKLHEVCYLLPDSNNLHSFLLPQGTMIHSLSKGRKDD